MTQAELAAAIGVSQTQIGRILNGERPLNVDQLVQLCRALRIDPLEVIREVDRALADTPTSDELCLAAKDVAVGGADVAGEDPDVGA